MYSMSIPKMKLLSHSFAYTPYYPLSSTRDAKSYAQAHTHDHSYTAHSACRPENATTGFFTTARTDLHSVDAYAVKLPTF